MGRKFYLLWLLGAALGALGAAADVAWHFSRVFDELSPPHNIATTGFILNIGLLYWALVRNRNRLSDGERAGLRLNAIGTALFLIGIPLDLTWHLIAGIDITTWSPTHLLLFYSAVIADVGALRAWLASPTTWRPGASCPGARAITFGIAFFLFSAMLFPLSQQEYAATALDSLNRTGRAPWYVAPDLWALAGPQAVKLARGGAPDWLYLIYISGLASLMCILIARIFAARRAASSRATFFPAATALTIALVLFRLAGRLTFTAIHLPIGSVPYWLIPLGLAADLAQLLAPRIPSIPHGPLPRWLPSAAIPAALGGLCGSLALYGALTTLHNRGDITPAAPLAALPVALLIGAIGAIIGVILADWTLGVSIPTAAPIPTDLQPATTHTASTPAPRASRAAPRAQSAPRPAATIAARAPK